VERPTFVYLKSADHPQTEETLVKSSRFFGITATICIVVQPLDHPTLLSLQLVHTASLPFQCSRNSRAKAIPRRPPQSVYRSLLGSRNSRPRSRLPSDRAANRNKGSGACRLAPLH